MKVDYLIIGQGLAGSVLAYMLIKQGKSVIVMDNNPEKRASTVAAGLFNPITGRKMLKTWKGNELFPFLHDFYPKLEKALGGVFFYPKPIYRPFLSYEEQNDWLGRSSTDEFNAFVKEICVKPTFGNILNDRFGGILLSECGFVDSSKLIELFLRFFKTQDAFVETNCNLSKLEMGEESIVCGEIVANKVICCDGPWGNENTFFSWLPFSLVKGEILDIVPEQQFDFILNRGVFAFRHTNGIYKVGSTYNNFDLTWDITTSARGYLTEKLDSLLKIKYKIVNQHAGVRPATKDRRPFVGEHPTHKNLYIFNGFGTKGISLIPYFASQFVDCLTGGKDVDASININRYFLLYYKNV